MVIETGYASYDSANCIYKERLKGPDLNGAHARPVNGQTTATALAAYSLGFTD
jgi:hypothetical protein